MPNDEHRRSEGEGGHGGAEVVIGGGGRVETGQSMVKAPKRCLLCVRLSLASHVFRPSPISDDHPSVTYTPLALGPSMAFVGHNTGRIYIWSEAVGPTCSSSAPSSTSSTASPAPSQLHQLSRLLLVSSHSHTLLTIISNI